MQSLLLSAACVISIIINAPAVSCTPKQIDLQAFFVTTAALLCQCVIGCKSAAAQYKRVIIWCLHKVF